MSKVVLFLPHYSGPPLGPPAGLLCLASSLLQRGVEVRIVDAAVDPDYLTAIERETEDALCFGVSLLTGPMIHGAINASERVKELHPDVQVVFGGWHPSLLADQTLRESFVDAVVRNQGELTFLELVLRLENGQGLDGVSGCSFKCGGRIFHNPDRPVARIDALPFPAYDLVDFDAYERASGERKLPFASSVGCPYACSYCTDTVFYGRRFNAYSARRVVDEVTQLVTRHHLNEVALLDSNFLVDGRRALEIARGFLEANLGFQWTFQASTDLLCRLSIDEVCLLGRSGVKHIGFGTESGSEQVLLRMNKFHQRVDDMFETARKCRHAGIRTTFNLIFGYPGESDGDRRETFRVMGEIASEFDNVTFSPNVFTPYPGIPIWKELRSLGLKEPQRLVEWADYSLGSNVLPWMQGATYRNVKRSMFFFMLNNELIKAARRSSAAAPVRLLRHALRQILRWRLKHHCFDWPLELLLFSIRNRLTMRRSLLTGQPLGHTLGETC
ncbi:MAG TPA: radical SAM protein [Acidobacteriota bacterium]|nr:radical SAM protein [Acidobacteriota bacterium]